MTRTFLFGGEGGMDGKRKLLLLMLPLDVPFKAHHRARVRGMPLAFPFESPRISR